MKREERREGKVEKRLQPQYDEQIAKIEDKNRQIGFWQFRNVLSHLPHGSTEQYTMTKR